MKKRRSDALRGLAQLGTRKQPEGSSFGDVLTSLGNRGFGWGFMLVGIINILPLPPGTNLILGIPVLFLSSQMMLGRKEIWLPEFITRRVIKRERWRKSALGALPVARPLSRLTRNRLSWIFQGNGERVLGFIMLLTGVVLCTPVPLVAWLPAISLFLVGLGLVEQDGLLVGIGGLIAILAISFGVAMVSAIYIGIAHAVQ